VCFIVYKIHTHTGSFLHNQDMVFLGKNISKLYVLVIHSSRELFIRIHKIEQKE